MNHARHYGFAVLVAWLALSPPPATAADRLVLVSSSKATLRATPLSEVRRTFLGAVHSHEAGAVVPVRNLANARAHELFVNAVLVISVSEYDRRLTARTLQSGLPLIAVARAQKDLERLLAEIPNAVTYVFESELANLPSLRVVQTLAATD